MYFSMLGSFVTCNKDRVDFEIAFDFNAALMAS